MTRNTASWVALVVLVALTLLTRQLADGGASPWILAGVAFLKILIIGAVFLELLRSWPVWAGLFGTAVLVVLGGSAWLIASWAAA